MWEDKGTYRETSLKVTAMRVLFWNVLGNPIKALIVILCLLHGHRNVREMSPVAPCSAGWGLRLHLAGQQCQRAAQAAAAPAASPWNANRQEQPRVEKSRVTPGNYPWHWPEHWCPWLPTTVPKLFFQATFLVTSSLPTSYKWCFHPKNDGTWEHASPGMQADQECRKTELWLCWIHRSKCTCLCAFLASVEETGGGNWLPPVPFL